MAVTKTISRDGETRAIKITGKAGSTFEFYIKQGSNYYNFDSNSFTSSIFILKKQEIPASGNYVKKVVIPAVTSNVKYDFFITPTGSSKVKYKDYRRFKGRYAISKRSCYINGYHN